jgi:L-lactate dehydrogenase (cytochrome)
VKEPVSIHDVRERARRRLPRIAFDFIDGGAGDEWTLRENRRAMDDVTLLPRTLQGVAKRDQGLRVFGQALETPVVLAPAGLLRIASRWGELAAARAAVSRGTIYTLTSNSSIALEEVGRHVQGDRVWFQLYLWRDRARNAELIERARAIGCRVLVITVDVPVAGKKDRDRRNGFTLPLQPSPAMVLDLARHPRWVWDYLRGGPITFANFTELGKGRKPEQLFSYINSELSHPGANFDDLAWLRSQWDGPLVVKGILTAADAHDLVDAGVDGICVSNHGGRQLDGVPAAISALPEVVDAVGGRAEVFVDGGFRRGSEVVKALALGARAVLVGRPYVWGLAMDGQRGAETVLDIFKQEIDLTLALIGRQDLAAVDDSAVRVGRSVDLSTQG